MTSCGSSSRSSDEKSIRLARAVAAQDPEEGLRAIAALRDRLQDLEARQVQAALKAGRSWREIAAALGISRQAAHRRHSARPLPPKPPVAAGSEAPVASAPKMVIVGPAREAVRLGRQEAATLNSPIVGTEHLLVGLLRQRKGLATAALTGLGVTLEKARHCVEATRDLASGHPETEDLAPPGWAAEAQRPFSQRARQALEQALREAVRLGDDRLDVEHLLLALLRDPDSRAVACLERLSVVPEMVEAELLGLRAVESEPSSR